MAKKPKDDVPNPNNVANREILQRMNFLYQASVLLNHTNAHPPRPPKPVKRKEDAVLAMLTKKETRRKERLHKRHPPTCEDLSKHYIQTMKAVGLKTNVRLCIPSIFCNIHMVLTILAVTPPLNGHYVKSVMSF